MKNPNNCSTCKYRRNPQGGHCYMFRDEPAEVCLQHTDRQEGLRLGLKLIAAIAEGTKPKVKTGG